MTTLFDYTALQEENVLDFRVNISFLNNKMPIHKHKHESQSGVIMAVIFFDREKKIGVIKRREVFGYKCR